MNNEREEAQRVEQWLHKLNTKNFGWTNGDIESRTTKTADMINRHLRIACELKREKGNAVDNAGDGNIVVLSNRLQDYFDLSSEKFEAYPEYKTFLIIELASYISIVQDALSGIQQIFITRDGFVTGGSIRNKKLYSNMENIGAVILWPAPGSPLNSGINKAYYFDNPFSEEACKLKKQEVEDLIGNKLEFMELNA